MATWKQSLITIAVLILAWMSPAYAADTKKPNILVI